MLIFPVCSRDQASEYRAIKGMDNDRDRVPIEILFIARFEFY